MSAFGSPAGCCVRYAHGAGAPPGRVAGAWLQSASSAPGRYSFCCSENSSYSGTAHWPVAGPACSGSWAASAKRHSAVALESVAGCSGSASANAAATDAGIGIDAGIGPPTDPGPCPAPPAPAPGAPAGSVCADPPASGHCTGIVHVPVAAGSVLAEPSGTIIGGGT